MEGVDISNTNHEENQPAHLTLKDPTVPANVNLRTYAGPEGRFCPAGVYEFIKNEDGSDRLQINAQTRLRAACCERLLDLSQRTVKRQIPHGQIVRQPSTTGQCCSVFAIPQALHVVVEN